MSEHDLPSFPANLCGCGSLEQAYAIAEKNVVNAVAADCPLWSLQVSTMMASLSLNLIFNMTQDAGANKEDATEQLNKLQEILQLYAANKLVIADLIENINQKSEFLKN